ncbi:MAG: amino acid ABC transporter substrate-binding protein, partial [Bacteroidota bacterium]
ALDRRFVFQANPPISTRGRVMARYALRQGENEVGVIARLGDAISERMAEGFENELYEEGGELAFYHLLESENGWTRLASEVGPDTLARTPALYLALSGGSARVPAEAALQSLEEAGLRPRIYGSDGWHHINQEDRASRFETTYATDFYVDETSSGVQNFRRRYQTLADADPDRPAFMGFDVATYILSRSVSRRGDDLIEILRNDISYQGLSTRLDFSRSNVNQALFIFGYRDGDRELLR